MQKRSSQIARPSTGYPSGPLTSFTARRPPSVSPFRSQSTARPRLRRPRGHWRQAGLVLATLLTFAVLLTFRSPAATGPAVPSGDGLPLAVTAGGTGLAAAVAQRAAPPGASGREAAAAPRVLARFADVELVTLNEEVRLVGFHEASYADALPLSPVGRMVFNDNPTKFAPSSAVDGPDYGVLSSRGRPNAATSAVDMVVPAGVPVTSVVTGTIGLVEPYLLYGRYPDTKVEIVPAARPDLRVVMIHLSDVQVFAGQQVVGGETIIAAGANRFPFASQVDRYLGEVPGPHVHIEVKSPPLGPPSPPGPPPRPVPADAPAA